MVSVLSAQPRPWLQRWCSAGHKHIWTEAFGGSFIQSGGQKTKNQLSFAYYSLFWRVCCCRSGEYPFYFLTPFFLLLRIPESLWFGKAGHGSYVVAVFSVFVCCLTSSSRPVLPKGRLYPWCSCSGSEVSQMLLAVGQDPNYLIESLLKLMGILLVGRDGGWVGCCVCLLCW